MEDWLEDSLAKIHNLGEFGIKAEDILSHAYKHCTNDVWEDPSHFQKLCWEHIPDELSYVNHSDDWGIPNDRMDDKRALFIMNSDEIEIMFGDLIQEVSYVYGDAFYRFKHEAHAKDIGVLHLDEVSTCLRYWK